MKILAIFCCLFGFFSLGESGGNVLCYYEYWSSTDLSTFNFNVCTHIIFAFIGVDSSGNIINNWAPTCMYFKLLFFTLALYNVASR